MPIISWRWCHKFCLTFVYMVAFMCMRIFIDNAKCIVNESYGYSPRMQPPVHKTECANFFQVYIANVGTFCATLVKGGGSACYKNRKRQVRLHRFYPAVVAYLCVCRRNFVAHNISTKMRSKLDTANSRTAKKIRWKLTDTRYSITKYDARTHDNRRMSEKR